MIHRWFLAWRDRRDKGLEKERARFGAKPVNGPYDQVKASAGFKKSRRQTEAGRPFKAPVRRKKHTAEIWAMPKRGTR